MRKITFILALAMSILSLQTAKADQIVSIDDLQNKLYSNAPCTNTQWGDQFEGHWENLFDNNAATIFHSEYGNKTSVDGLDHYIRVDMGEGQSVQAFVFTFRTRNTNCTVNSPTEIVVEGSNEAEGTYDVIATLTGLPTTNSTDYTSDVLTNGNAYRFIRYRVTKTMSMQTDGGGKVFFFISEFGMNKVEQGETIVTELANFNPNKFYTVSTNGRGGWSVKADGSQFCSTADGGLGTNVDAANTRNQFAILTVDNENYYLFSVHANKFIKRDRTLVEGPGDPIEFAQADDGERVRVNFKGIADSYINLGGSNQMVIDSWSTMDAGNKVKFVEAGNFDPTAALAMLAPQQPEGEKLFEATTISNGQFAKSTTWYTMQIGASGLVIGDNGSSNHIALNNPKSDVNNAAQLWAFVGDNTYGYKLYNKQGGTAKVLAAPTDMIGNTGAESYPILVDANAVPEGYTDMWLFAASDKLGEGDTYFYMYEKDYPSNKVNNRNGKFAFWSTGADAGSTLNILFAETSVPVNSESGVFTASNSNNTWHSRWESSVVEGLSLSTNANNMTVSNGSIAGYSGQSGTSTYTITAPEGIDVTAISASFVNSTAENYALTLTIEGETYTSSATAQALNVNFETPARTARFTQSGANKGITFNDLYITLKRTKDEAAAGTDIFITLQGGTPYRIPAITLANNGDLIAVADYRPCGGDIGNGRVDLYTSISKDNGANWSAAQPIIEGQSWEAENRMYVGFGDPAIVADRESNRVLMLSCGGDITFQSGTPDHHQNIVRFYSDNNGETWSEPVDIAPAIYGMWDNSVNHGPAKAMFVGSGKIHQSRYVKVNDYYRLYCSVLLRNKNNAYTNFVLYSDDFGGNWGVLGGVEVAPIPSGGDEPKVEELPNGNVVLSSRVGGGRLFNIFTFTDFENAYGTWGTHATSNANNGGVVALNNSTNGEILIMPAIRKADSEKVWIALQSVPFGSGRANVGIFYKELASEDDYNTPANFAKDWDGSFQISRIGSAYSTMCFQSDSTIAFLYEEETYGAGYTIVYRNFSLEQITDSLYQISGDITMPTPDFESTVTDLIVKAQQLLSLEGVGYPKADDEGRDALAEAIATAESEEPSAATITALQSAIETYCSITDVELPVAGKAYTITVVAKSGRKYYLNYATEGLQIIERAENAQLPLTALFGSEANENGGISLKTIDGKYLVYHDKNGQTKVTDANYQGFQDGKDKRANITFTKIVNGGSVAANGNEQLFGLLYWNGLRGHNSNGGEVYGAIVVKTSDRTFDAADAPYFNDTYSSAILLEEYNSQPTVGGFYNIRSANTYRDYVNTTALIYATNAGNAMKWANGHNGANSNAVWTIEKDGNNYYAKNVHTNMYMNGLGLSETAANVAPSLLGDDQYIIRANGNMLHAQSANNGIANWDCTSEGQSNKSNASAWYIDEVESFGYTLSVSAAEWSTVILGYNAVIPENVTCYAVSSINGDWATLSEVEGILPANTAVFVNAAQGDYTFTYTATAAEATSMLAGTLYNKNIEPAANARIYVLSIVNGVVGLYPAKVNEEGTVFNNANKAYLEIASASKAIQFNFEGTTGIENVQGADAEAVIYDLTGRRVQQMNAAGIYIVNGKKVLVK